MQHDSAAGREAECAQPLNMCAYQFTSTASSTARSSTSSPCGANSVVWGFKWPTVCDTLVWRRCNGARGSICKSSGGFSPPASNVADRAYFGACRPNLLEPNGEWDTRRVQSTVGVQWLQIKLDRNEWRPARLAGLQSLRSAHVDCIGAGVWPEKEAGREREWRGCMGGGEVCSEIAESCERGGSREAPWESPC